MMTKTRKEKVFDRLIEQPGEGWVDGYILCHPGIGGSEGLRRLRELRAEGHSIEKRRKPRTKNNVYQYRLHQHDWVVCSWGYDEDFEPETQQGWVEQCTDCARYRTIEAGGKT